MKYLLICFVVISFNNGYSQSKEQKLLIKNKIGKKIIQGFQYQNDSLVKQTHLVDELDAYGNSVSFKTYDLNDSLIGVINYKFSDDGTTEFSKELDKEGHLKYSMITISDNKNNSVRRMQISAEGDTLVDQIWIRDHNLNDSLLIHVKNGKRILRYKWEYNDGGMLISKGRFNDRGDLIEKDHFNYQREGNCIITKDINYQIISVTCTEGKRKINKIQKNSEGYRAGIKLVSEKGGERVETKLENGLLEKIEYFSKKGKLLAIIKYTYVNN